MNIVASYARYGTSFHTTHRFNGVIAHFLGPEHDSEIQPEIVKELYKIPGIDSIFVDGYKISIIHALAFDRKLIDEAAHMIIEKYIQEQEDQTDTPPSTEPLS